MVLLRSSDRGAACGSARSSGLDRRGEDANDHLDGGVDAVDVVGGEGHEDAGEDGAVEDVEDLVEVEARLDPGGREPVRMQGEDQLVVGPDPAVALARLDGRGELGDASSKGQRIWAACSGEWHGSGGEVHDHPIARLDVVVDRQADQHLLPKGIGTRNGRDVAGNAWCR
jgi:hypothetical protein